MQVLSYYNINKNHLCINAGATVRTTYAHHFFPTSTLSLGCSMHLPQGDRLTKVEQQFP